MIVKADPRSNGSETQTESAGANGRKIRRSHSADKRVRVAEVLMTATQSAHSRPTDLKTGDTNMKSIAMPLIVVAAAALAGCGNTTGARVGTGTALGLATGAAIGSFSAQAGAGALIGAGVGALGGFLVDEHQRGNFN
jgi:hypothetical protein